MKDDACSCAVFTERSSSASQMTAEKVMNVTARLPHCDGQAADAVSAYTPRCSKIKEASKVSVSQINGYVFHDTNGRNPGQTLKILWYLSNDIYIDTHWQDYSGKDNLREVLLDIGWEKYHLWNVCSSKTRITLISTRG